MESSHNTQKHYDYINPKHYQSGDFEVWEIMVKLYGVEEYKSFCKLNALKYRLRAGMKPDQPIDRDIEKALWYENKMNEL